MEMMEDNGNSKRGAVLIPYHSEHSPSPQHPVLSILGTVAVNVVAANHSAFQSLLGVFTILHGQTSRIF